MRPWRELSGPTELYRAYDANDVLLYVGIAVDATARVKGHRSNRRWWRSEVDRVEVESYPTRAAARDAEIAAINAELPVYNNCAIARRARGEMPGRVTRPRKPARRPIPRGPSGRLRPRPVALVDIADLLGVTVEAVKQWRMRAPGMKRAEPFPPPVGTIAKSAYWWEDEILAWGERTGRIQA